MRQRVTVGRVLGTEVVALHAARKTLADRCTGDIHFLTRLENSHADLAARLDIVAFTVSQAKFPKAGAGLGPGLGKMPGHCLVDTAGATLAGGHLKRPVAVHFCAAHLSHPVRVDFNHGYRHRLTVLGEDASHTCLSAY